MQLLDIKRKIFVVTIKNRFYKSRERLIYTTDRNDLKTLLRTIVAIVTSWFLY